MPVIDHTIHTLELKRFKEDIEKIVEEIKKRLEALEKKSAK